MNKTQNIQNTNSIIATRKQANRIEQWTSYEGPHRLDITFNFFMYIVPRHSAILVKLFFIKKHGPLK